MKYFLLFFFLLIKIADAKNISISGHKCLGDENTAAEMDGKWADYYCSPNEWFMVVDQDSSTKKMVIPFFAKLKISLMGKSESSLHYNIVPTIPVGASFFLVEIDS